MKGLHIVFLVFLLAGILSLFWPKRFVLAQANEKSERCSVFGRVILQKDKNIKRTEDIKRLVLRGLDLWGEKKV